MNNKEEVLEYLQKLNSIGVSYFKNSEFEVSFKDKEKKLRSSLPIKIPDITSKSIEDELFEDIDKRVNIPHLTETI